MNSASPALRKSIPPGLRSSALRLSVAGCLLTSVLSGSALAQTNVFPGDGNVGIGTIAPERILHVVRSAPDGTPGATANSYEIALFKVNGSGGGQRGLEIGAPTGSISSPVYLKVHGTSSRFAILNEVNSEQFTILGSGNVGIGTASPAGSLHIVSESSQSNSPGVGIFLGKSLANDYEIQLTQSGGTPHIDLSRGTNSDYDARISSPADNQLSLGTIGGGQVLNIVSGNVGIGTTSPGTKVEVVDGGGSYQIGTNSSYWSGFKTTAPAGIWGFQQNERAFFGLGGNLYNRGFSNNAISIFNGSTIAEDIVLFNQNNPSAGFLVLKASGNVGIGTSAPTHKLAVNGTIRAKEVIVDTGWADYVFAKGYRLAPLAEVEQHIEKEGHLPGIPSAAEVAERGVSMGEMQAKMMAKIEELTLHAIEREKHDREQEKLLRQQATEIASLRAELARLSTQK